MTKEERSWILYDWANSAYSVAITTALLPIFFKDYAAAQMPDYLSTAYWGYSSTIATLIVAILAPILGTIADYKNYKKRFLLFFLLMGVVFTASLSLIQEGQWFFALVLYVLSSIGFSGANVFYDSFLTDVTSKERMNWVSSSGFGWGYIGSTIPFLIGLIFILNPSLIGLNSTISATKLAFVITAAWWLIFSIPIMKNVKQTYYVEKTKTPIKDSFKRITQFLKNLKGNKNVFLFLMAYFFYIDGVDTIIRMSSSYGLDVGLNANDLLVVFLVIQIVAFPFALLYGRLSKRFSTKSLIYFAIFVYTFITVFAFFLETIVQFWILAMLVASSQGGIQALSRSLYGRMIPKDRSAEYFGFYNIFGKFSAILGPFLVGIFTQIGKSSRWGVASLLFLFIIGAILFYFVKEPEKA
ncbi:MFS transporter [Petrotoga miotherma DSM 10691]|uniref:MFS transporter n=1 Tax=Petrotoga miotherma DSM 10691 TaxID=1434326 RepID=A0A2K1PI91_9BACT|nr:MULTISPECIES: MFS transporter [Petrotoga]MDN5346071.1 transporter, family [Petrotoga sp.]PNS02508.1 MFS transporter [Petrotoga miotherma DSM 10691]